PHAPPLGGHDGLFSARGSAPAYPESSLDDPALAPVRTAIDHILNFADWARHILERIGHLPELRAELAQYVPELEPPAGHLGFAVPLHLRTSCGSLCLMTTVTPFPPAVDVTLAELKLEASLPADQVTAEILQSARNASTSPASQGPVDHVRPA